MTKRIGGPDRDRTGDLLNAIQARSQLRYRPIWGKANPHFTITIRWGDKTDAAIDDDSAAGGPAARGAAAGRRWLISSATTAAPRWWDRSATSAASAKS